MTIGDWLARATEQLNTSGIATARLDCLVLLEDSLGIERAHLLAHPERKISPLPLLKLNTKITQRAKHVPLAYIRGHLDFYGRRFAVNKHVLCPRPETEAMIELLKTTPLPSSAKIIDVGTGSGCLAITAALELSDAQVTASDIDRAALRVARRNARNLGAKVQFVSANLLGSKPQDYYVVLANLPYVPTTMTINKEAAHEPSLALFAGRDGLDLYHRFWQQLKALSEPPHVVLTESLSTQHAELHKLAGQAGFKLAKSSGLAQLFERKV